MLRWATMLAALILATACKDGRITEPDDGRDASATSGEDASTPRPPAEGVALSITAAEWTSSDVLRVGVQVANAASGAPAPLIASAFSLETDGGAIVSASVESATLCPAGIAVAPGAALGCAVEFVLPAGHAPSSVNYRADAERSATAEVRECSPAATQGLCPWMERCVDGACVGPCSSEVPDGACPAGLSCLDGACRESCSPEHPEGWCDEGACVDGACDPSCRTLTTSSACTTCLAEVSSGTCSTVPNTCADQETCARCLLTATATTCECVADPACDGCEAEVTASFECLARECPACFG